MREAVYYTREGKNARCNLCERGCLIPPGGRGVCLTRENRDGKLYTLVYGKVVAIALDPIEKKPIFHFLPGSYVLSYATAGCNFKCPFCQNWEISQRRPEDVPTRFVAPAEMVKLAGESGSVGIAHTYTEPTVFFEYARDVGVLAKREGLTNVWVSNGYFSSVVAEDIARWVDAINIDLKGDARFYKGVLGGLDIEVVKRNIRFLYKRGVHVEVTTLIIPGYNDDRETYVSNVVEFLLGISKDIPLHITRFHPDFRMQNVPPTPVDTLVSLREAALENGLRYVYVGNVGDPSLETTYCPNCGYPVIERKLFSVQVNLEGNRCPQCGSKVHVITKI